MEDAAGGVLVFRELWDTCINIAMQFSSSKWDQRDRLGTATWRWLLVALGMNFPFWRQAICNANGFKNEKSKP